MHELFYVASVEWLSFIRQDTAHAIGDFGRDYDEDVEAKMWKKYGRDLITENDDGVVEDVRGLTGNEIRFLDTITRRLMDRRRDGRG